MIKTYVVFNIPCVIGLISVVMAFVCMSLVILIMTTTRIALALNHPKVSGQLLRSHTWLKVGEMSYLMTHPMYVIKMSEKYAEAASRVGYSVSQSDHIVDAYCVKPIAFSVRATKLGVVLMFGGVFTVIGSQGL